MLRIIWRWKVHRDLDRLSADSMPSSMWDFHHMSLPQQRDYFCTWKRKEFSVLITVTYTICLDMWGEGEVRELASQIPFISKSCALHWWAPCICMLMEINLKRWVWCWDWDCSHHVVLPGQLPRSAIHTRGLWGLPQGHRWHQTINTRTNMKKYNKAFPDLEFSLRVQEFCK